MNPLDAWFALSSQAAPAEAETDRMVMQMLASVKLKSPQRLANRTGNTGSPRKLRQLPRNGIVAIDTGFGPVALTIGSRKSKSTGRQAGDRVALGALGASLSFNGWGQ